MYFQLIYDFDLTTQAFVTRSSSLRIRILTHACGGYKDIEEPLHRPSIVDQATAILSYASLWAVLSLYDVVVLRLSMAGLEESIHPSELVYTCFAYPER